MRKELLNRAEKAVEIGKKAGANDVWAGAGRSRSVSFQYRDGTLEQVSESTSRSLSVALYVGLGWIALVAASEIVSEYLGGPLALLVAGGLLYTIGGLVYASRWPNPWPRVFGYHEVFHAFVVAGSAVHYSAVVAYIL